MYENSARETLPPGFSRQTYSLKPDRVVPSAKYQVLDGAPVRPTVSEPPLDMALAHAGARAQHKTTIIPVNADFLRPMINTSPLPARG
jgi:hypothetical protein